MTISRQTSIVPAGKIHVDSRKVIIREKPLKAPQVIVNRDDDVIRSIVVHCSCGEQVVLDCDYAESSLSVAPDLP